jgi:hypothetical protein
MLYRIRLAPLFDPPPLISMALVLHLTLVIMPVESWFEFQAWSSNPLASTLVRSTTDTESPHTTPSNPTTIPGQWRDSIELSWLSIHFCEFSSSSCQSTMFVFSLQRPPSIVSSFPVAGFLITKGPLGLAVGDDVDGNAVGLSVGLVDGAKDVGEKLGGDVTGTVGFDDVGDNVGGAIAEVNSHN